MDTPEQKSGSKSEAKSGPREVVTRRHGRFITLEGGEGTGKSTQVHRLVARLAALGIDVIATREPGGSPGAERLRSIILSGALESFGATAETLMFSAARIDHLDKTIRPALEEGCFVVCDRFIDSTRAYQGVSGNVDPRLIAQLETIVVGETMPDLTIVLDIPAEEGLRRARARNPGPTDRFESEDLSFHKTVREAFLAIAHREPQRCVVVDASMPVDEVEASIWRVVQERLLTEPETRRRRGRPPGQGRPANAGSHLRLVPTSNGNAGEDGPAGKPGKEPEQP